MKSTRNSGSGGTRPTQPNNFTSVPAIEESFAVIQSLEARLQFRSKPSPNSSAIAPFRKTYNFSIANSLDKLHAAVTRESLSDQNQTQPGTVKLRREMGFWDVLLFNIAAVLGPRWIAAAAHNGPSSIVLWIIAAIFFFVPTALIIAELSTRFPSEGGLYVWSKEAFGDFHGFVAGWSYWVYSFFYFPGLLSASAAMGVYIGGQRMAHLNDSPKFLIIGSLVILFIAVAMNIVGLNVGKWLQNAGGVGTYVPLLILMVVGLIIWKHHGSATAFTWAEL